MYSLGWFSTGRGPGSRNLLTAMQDSIRRGEVKAGIRFVFCSREPGESPGSDLFVELVRSYHIPLVCFSSRKFQPQERKEAVLQWRLDYDREVMKQLEGFHPDLCVLAGYMLIVGPEMCQKYKMVNLHPAAPGGPTGTWQEVIWKLIETKAESTGAMMHLVTPELDKGPPVTFCTFPIKGGPFDRHWKEMEGLSIEEVKRRQGEDNALFKLIRQQGVAREVPLVISTVKAFSEGRVRVERGQVVDARGRPITAYDLTAEINETVQNMESRTEFRVLLDLLARMIHAVHVSSIGDSDERERLVLAHSLANRFIQYALTQFHLCNAECVETLPSLGDVKAGDPASIDVLTRAAMEAFLVFHWVFYSPATKDERDYRYWTYMVGGLVQRQDLPDVLWEARQKMGEKKTIEQIVAKLESNSTYRALTDNQRAGLINGKQRDLWRWGRGFRKVISWQEIATDAGFSEMLASHMYRYLSGHAHSGSLSVLQTQQAIVRKEEEVLTSSSIAIMDILVANMIREYAELFPEGQAVLVESGAGTFVDIWIQTGRRLDENQSAG